MLSREENELLTRIGPGTPMGELMRQYWIPVLLGPELPEPDGAPARVRVLGEDLIAFRDTNGRVGLLGNHCSHRGASLFFGRNEDGGLRCVYHGWKYDVDGRCVDMPNEPPESTFKDKVRQQAYPCREQGGIIWAYLGLRSEPPPLPALEWTALSDDHRYITKRWQESNYLQGLEGDLDSSHVSFLHTAIDGGDTSPEAQKWGATGAFRSHFLRDRHPVFECAETEWGMTIAARRAASADRYYWRISQFLMPFFTMIPPFDDDPTIRAKAWVPIDDENHMNWTASCHPTRPLTDRERAVLRSGRTAHVGVDQFLPPTSEPGGRWKPIANRTNDYLIDWEAQRTRLFSGPPGNWGQDAAVQDSMGTIYDRTQEHLGTADMGVIQVRKLLMSAARALHERSVVPPGVDNPAAYRVRAASMVLPQDMPWVERSAGQFIAPRD